MSSLQAFSRADGSVGIRNIVLVVSTVTCANTVVNHIAWKTGAVPLTHERGCVEGEQSFRRTMLALTTFAKHPNVSGVLIVGLGCEQIRTLDLQVAIGGGKPVHAILIQEEGGSVEAEARGCELVREMQRAAQDLERQPCPLSGLVVGVQCGGSDWTTAIAGNTVIGAMTDLVIAAGGSVLMSEVPGIPGCEHIVASRAVSREAGEQILGMVDELRAEFLRAHGQPIEAVNPTPGNKAGGITTLVEKAMGNIKKMGTSPVQGVLKLGKRPPASGPGDRGQPRQRPLSRQPRRVCHGGGVGYGIQHGPGVSGGFSGHARGQADGQPAHLRQDAGPDGLQRRGRC